MTTIPTPDNPWMFPWPVLLDGQLIDRWNHFKTRDVDAVHWRGDERRLYDAAKAACREEMLHRGLQP